MDRFTEEQLQEYKDAFCMYDRSNKGFILSLELRDMLKTVGYNPTDKNLEEMTILIDLDGNGEIEFEEFIDLIDKLETEENATIEAQICFNAFDFMGNGYVSAHDLQEALMYILEKAPESDKQDIIETFKLKKNRKISFKEFKAMMTLTK